MADLESQLEELGNAIRGLSTDVSRPKTAFDLLDMEQYEDAWQSYLQYFLSPDQPHRLEGAFLTRFLAVLEENEIISFSPPETGLRPGQGIEVTAERQSQDANRPDLIVTSGSEWFLCIELKVHATEGGGKQSQTTRYANDENIVPNGVSNYEDGDYLYVKPGDADSSISSAFSDLDWRQVQSVIRDTLAHSTGDLPTRSVAQLSDFSTLIDSQLTMTDIDEETRQRKDLYFQYRDAITEARDAVEPFVKTILQQNWAQELAGSYQPNSADGIEWEYGSIGRGYGQARTSRWKEAKSGPEKLDIHWEHKPIEDDFSKGQLRFILELEEPDRSTISADSGERYHRFRDDVLAKTEESVQSVTDPRWEELDVSPGRSQKKLVRLVYEYQPGDEDGYYQGLQFALEDSEPITRVVTDLLESKDYTQYPVE